MCSVSFAVLLRVRRHSKIQEQPEFPQEHMNSPPDLLGELKRQIITLESAGSSGDFFPNESYS